LGVTISASAAIKGVVMEFIGVERMSKRIASRADQDEPTPRPDGHLHSVADTGSPIHI